MIFDIDYVAFELLDVLYFNQACTAQRNFNRNFDALSFRVHADTVIASGGKRLELADNSVCYFPANVDYIRDSKMDEIIVVHLKTFNYHSNNVEYFAPKNPEKYRKLFKEILECWKDRKTAYKNTASAMLSNIFAELYKDSGSVCKNPKLLSAVEYINRNCNKTDFSLEEAAARAFVSEQYFRRMFNEEFGMTPKHYVITQRMDYAKSLILAGYFSIKEVAQMCGYNDAKHFSTEFKKFVGVRPTEFRYNYSD